MKNILMTIAVILGITLITPGLLANGLNLNGNGSKAVAMGGAFVGLADDFSAVFWNPAGLTQLKGSSLSFFGTDVIPTATYQFDPLGIDAESKTMHYISGGLGFFKAVSDRVTVGMYAYVPSGSGVNWDPKDLSALSGGRELKWKSLIAIATLSPAIAVKISDKFSMGGTLNINYGLIQMKRPAKLGPLGAVQYEEDLNGMSVNASIGMLYKPTEKFSMGFTYKTPISIKVTGKADLPAAAYMGLPASDDAERTTTWPMWLGFGLCYKPTSKLTLTGDVQYTNWKEMTVIPVTYYTESWKTYFEAASSFELKWKDTFQIRFGAEYKINDGLAVRCGYYYDPNPSPLSTQTIILPEVTYHFFNCGVGLTRGKVTVDLTLEYGNGTKIELPVQQADPKAGIPGFHDNNVIVPNLSITLHL